MAEWLNATVYFFIKKISGLLEELVDSPPCHGGYTAGSSPVQLASFKADLAQLVEPHICNMFVIGSNPIVGSILYSN